jgi:hypothetical protein
MMASPHCDRRTVLLTVVVCFLLLALWKPREGLVLVAADGTSTSTSALDDIISNHANATANATLLDDGHGDYWNNVTNNNDTLLEDQNNNTSNNTNMTMLQEKVNAFVSLLEEQEVADEVEEQLILEEHESKAADVAVVVVEQDELNNNTSTSSNNNSTQADQDDAVYTVHDRFRHCPVGREPMETFDLEPSGSKLAEVSYMAHSRQKYRGSSVLWYVYSTNHNCQ